VTPVVVVAASVAYGVGGHKLFLPRFPVEGGRMPRIRPDEKVPSDQKRVEPAAPTP